MTFDPTTMPTIALRDGNSIPQLGLGVYKVSQNVAVDLIQSAIDTGYRRIDTAALYGNEAEVGAGIRASKIAREEIFVTTKIWNDRQGFAESKVAIDESLARLDIDYIDLLLIHWPCPAQDLFLETWRAFQEVVATGKVRSIGVSNFQPTHLEKLVAAGGAIPTLNQVELHPAFQQAEVRKFGAAHDIKTEAWAPLGRGRYSENEVLSGLAAKHGKSVAQIILRWHIQLGNLVIPKTTNPERLAENINVFDFTLDETEMRIIGLLDAGERTGPNPDEFG